MDAVCTRTPAKDKARLTFETAAEQATARVPVAGRFQRVGEVRSRLAGQHYEAASHIVVCEANTFLGIVTIEELLLAAADATVESLMDRDAPVVAPGVDQEVAAWRAVRHGESALAVVPRRFQHRLPWLLLGLGGALLAADVVGSFQAHLQLNVMLAFFISSIVYLADAAGTQTETVVVRGLSLGVPIRRMVWRELLTGVLIGLALAATALPFVWWRWHDTGLALAVSLSASPRVRLRRWRQ